MPSARLSELPEPPSGKTGWPWTEESSPCVDQTPVSIVTPSYQQGQFLEACIRSVLLQGIPNLELRVMDGGSDDSTGEILEKYAPWLDHWQSEADEGQGAAINAGLAQASGEVLGWMNSDDMYMPGGIARLLALREAHAASGVWIGASEVRDDQEAFIKLRTPVLGTREEFGRWFVDAGFHQPGALFSRQVYETTGGVNERYKCFLDVDFWLRAFEHTTFVSCDDCVAMARVYDDAKSSRLADRQIAEWIHSVMSLGMPEVAEWRIRRSLDRAADPDRVLPQVGKKRILRRLFES